MPLEIEARDLLLIRERRTILDVPYFVLPRGEVTALVGPNGAGKTTFMLVLAALERPSGGTVRYDGRTVARGNSCALRRRMAVVFQEPLLLDTSVLGNVMTGLRLRGVPRDEARRRAATWLSRLGIVHLAHRSARHLSGGEARRVSLARAFALEPEVLFLDEPFTALDYPTRCGLWRELGGLLRETGVTTLFITHDYREIPGLAHRVAVMEGGRVVRVGTPEEVLSGWPVGAEPNPW
ncbi:MAG: ATP-binding cassette domain-containing protein [Firmicutes bacterium]|nr:ATP-binding cassette domain-containing protein [Bacillota bacterium]